jgi:signal transduction histidine kinase
MMGSVVTNFLPAMGMEKVQTVGFLGTLGFMAAVLSSIYRYRLMNIRLAVMRYLILALFWVVMAFLYTGLAHGFHLLFPKGGRLVINFIVMGLFVFLFQLIWRQLLPAIEKLIYPLRSDLKSLLSRFDQGASLAFNEKGAVEALLSTVQDALNMRGTAVYVKESQSGIFECLAHSTEEGVCFPDRIEPNFSLSELADSLIREELRRDIDIEFDAPAVLALKRRWLLLLDHIGCEALFPMISRNGLIGFFCFAKKGRGIIYDPEDIEFLTLLSNRAASVMEGIHRIRELKEKENLARIGEMTAGIAHEVKNPLGAIIGAAETLQRDATDDKNRRFLAIITEESARLNRIVRNFLLFAKPQAAEIEQTDVRQLLQRCVSLFSAETNSGAFKITIEGAGKPLAHLDPDMTKQIFFNLVCNSVDAKEDGSLIIQVQESGRWIRVVFRDTCGGMSPEAAENIFSPFHTTKPSGTGLGLAIVQKLIAAMNGEMYFINHPGEGVEFLFDFKKA